jgi:hypothetical protein
MNMQVERVLHKTIFYIAIFPILQVKYIVNHSWHWIGECLCSGSFDAHLSCSLERRWKLLINISFTWSKLKFAFSITNEVRYRNSVLHCYTVVIQCSCGFFLSSLATAGCCLTVMRSQYFPGEGFQADTLECNMNHMWGSGEIFWSVRLTRQRLSWSHWKTQLGMFRVRLVPALVRYGPGRPR